MQGSPVQAGITADQLEEYEYELEREDARHRARAGMLAFTLFTKANYRVNWHHRVLCEKLDAFARGEIKRLIVTMPPRHGKSELVSRKLPAFLLGRNPDAKVIAASHTGGLAAAMNRDVARLMDSPAYRELFPDTRIPAFGEKTGDGNYARNSELFEVVGRTGSYRCAGVGGALTGHGGDFLILDDPVKNQEEADSEVYRQKVWDWYSTAFASRLEGVEEGGFGAEGGILITTTRWHEDDLVGRLLALAKTDPEADQWEVVNFPAIKEKIDFPGDPRALDEALWPEKYPIERLKKIRATQGARHFTSLYQQRPTALEGLAFKRIWTKNRYLTLPDLHRDRWDELILSADLRFKEDKNTGDFVVIDAWARKQAKIYFLGQARGRWGFVESLKQFAKMSAATPIGNFKPKLKLVENKANGPALENMLKTKITGIVLVEPNGSKRARLETVTPLWEAGNVWLPDDSIYPEIDAIIEEWVSFGPGCAFDDRTDTMSQALIRFQEAITTDYESLTRW